MKSILFTLVAVALLGLLAAGNGRATSWPPPQLVLPWEPGKEHAVLVGSVWHNPKSGPGFTNDAHALDFTLALGEPVRPVAEGTVRYAGDYVAKHRHYPDLFRSSWSCFGNAVSIQHDGGFVSFYAHLSEINPFIIPTKVNPTPRVTAETVIGKAGNSGADRRFFFKEGESRSCFPSKQPGNGVHLHVGFYELPRPAPTDSPPFGPEARRLEFVRCIRSPATSPAFAECKDLKHNDRLKWDGAQHGLSAETPRFEKASLKRDFVKEDIKTNERFLYIFDFDFVNALAQPIEILSVNVFDMNRQKVEQDWAIGGRNWDPRLMTHALSGNHPLAKIISKPRGTPLEQATISPVGDRIEIKVTNRILSAGEAIRPSLYMLSSKNNYDSLILQVAHRVNGNLQQVSRTFTVESIRGHPLAGPAFVQRSDS